MDTFLGQLTDGIALNGDVRHDVPTFLAHHGCPKTALHSAAVAAEARRIAINVGANGALAEQAGWLHDISAIFPNEERMAIARRLGLQVLREEEVFPMIVHQKLSSALARDVFGVSERAVLSAIGCHTTLKAHASVLDKVVFVADKLAWDQPGVAPYHEDLMRALNSSLDAAALVYLRHIWNQRDSLRVIHPWLREAYVQLSQISNEDP